MHVCMQAKRFLLRLVVHARCLHIQDSGGTVGW
jgi:hypothetical protein